MVEVLNMWNCFFNVFDNFARVSASFIWNTKHGSKSECIRRKYAVFYSVMFAGFVLAGILVSYCAVILKCRNKNVKDVFCLEYGLLIWCAFDLTMLPLGFGIISTLIFMITSAISFCIIECLCRYIAKILLRL